MDEYLSPWQISLLYHVYHWDIISPPAFKIRTRALLQVPAVCLRNRHRDIISKQTFRVCQISDQLGILGGAGWGDSSPDPHNFQARELRAIYLLLGVPPQLFPEAYHRYGHLEEQHKFVSFVMRPPSCRGWNYDWPSSGWSKSHSLKTSG